MKNSIPELTSAFLSEELSAEQVKALFEQICSDQAADKFVFESFVDSELRSRLSQEEIHRGIVAILERESSTDEPQRKPRQTIVDSVADKIHWSRHPLNFFATVVVLSIGLWVLFAALTGHKHEQQVKTAKKPTPNAAEIDNRVARIVSVDQPRWTGNAPVSRGLVAGQRLAFESGRIEIWYQTGAQVVIEGPADFTVAPQSSGESSADASGHEPFVNSGALHLGKLVARVEGETARGFAIESPLATVVDHGTEFAVEVNQLGEPRVFVFEGSVDVTGSTPAELHCRLQAGQGIAFNAAGETKPVLEPFGEEYITLTRSPRKTAAQSIVSDLDLGLAQQPFQSGAPRLSDQITEIVDSPQLLVGLTAIIPPRGAGLKQPGAGYRFQVAKPARLYLLVHNRGSHNLEDWQRTEHTITWTIEGQTHTDTVYTRRVEPGEVEIPAHSWRDELSQFGVPHVCLVAPLSESSSESATEKQN